MVAEFDPANGTDPVSGDPDLDLVIDSASTDTDPPRHIDVVHLLLTLNASVDLDPKKPNSLSYTQFSQFFELAHF